MADEEKELPSPRFDVVSNLFDEVDELLAKFDEKHSLTLFEFEILALMLRKKIEHMGLIATFAQEEPHVHEEPSKPVPEHYK